MPTRHWVGSRFLSRQACANKAARLPKYSTAVECVFLLDYLPLLRHHVPRRYSIPILDVEREPWVPCISASTGLHRSEFAESPPPKPPDRPYQRRRPRLEIPKRTPYPPIFPASPPSPDSRAPTLETLNTQRLLSTPSTLTPSPEEKRPPRLRSDRT